VGKKEKQRNREAKENRTGDEKKISQETETTLLQKLTR